MTKSLVSRILKHPDREEIINKLLLNISSEDIHDWLEAKYSELSEKSLIISTKSLSIFARDHLEMYSIIKDDISEKYNKSIQKNNSGELQEVLNGNTIYNKKLNEYLDNEIDIKKTMIRLLVGCEHRLTQLFELTQADVENIRTDNALLQWFTVAANLLEKLNTINNSAPDQNINITNNISVQLVDEKIHVFSGVIKNILSKLDYETSMLFIDLFNEEMNKLKDISSTDFNIISATDRQKSLETISIIE